MKVISRTKDGQTKYYIIQKQYKDDGELVNRVYKALGSEEKLLKKCTDTNLEKYLNKELIAATKEANTISVPVDYDKEIEEENEYNRNIDIGAIFVYPIYKALGLFELTEEIQKENELDYDFSSIIFDMVVQRMKDITSVSSFYSSRKRRIELKEYTHEEAIKALEVISSMDNRFYKKMRSNYHGLNRVSVKETNYFYIYHNYEDQHGYNIFSNFDLYKEELYITLEDYMASSCLVQKIVQVIRRIVKKLLKDKYSDKMIKQFFSDIYCYQVHEQYLRVSCGEYEVLSDLVKVYGFDDFWEFFTYGKILHYLKYQKKVYKKIEKIFDEKKPKE